MLMLCYANQCTFNQDKNSVTSEKRRSLKCVGTEFWKFEGSNLCAGPSAAERVGIIIIIMYSK